MSDLLGRQGRMIELLNCTKSAKTALVKIASGEKQQTKNTRLLRSQGRAEQETKVLSKREMTVGRPPPVKRSIQYKKHRVGVRKKYSPHKPGGLLIQLL